MQPDDSRKKKTDTSTGPQTSVDQYLAYLYVCRGQIAQISQWIDITPQWEIARDYETLNNLNLQLADVIHNLETLSGNPLGSGFNKRDVLRHLNNASIEINIASHLAGASDPQTQTLCFQHIVACRYYLNLAISLIPSQTSS